MSFPLLWALSLDYSTRVSRSKLQSESAISETSCAHVYVLRKKLLYEDRMEIFPTDGFLRRIWNVSVMVYFLPNHCYLLDFWSQKNVQLYWVDGWISNPQILANLLGFCGSSLYGLFIFVLFHQIHPHYIRKGLRISTVGWNAWFHDQFVIDGKSFSFFLHPFLSTVPASFTNA